MNSRRLTYQVWHAMLARCNDEEHGSFANYGARGIKVCASWHDFDAFVRDMGLKAREQCIDRIDNDGNYEPGNCRWVTRADSNRNRRDTYFVTHAGRTACLAQWAAAVGLSRQTLWARLSLGWSFEEAIATPVMRRRVGCTLVQIKSEAERQLEIVKDALAAERLKVRVLTDAINGRAA